MNRFWENFEIRINNVVLLHYGEADNNISWKMGRKGFWKGLPDLLI